MRPASFKLLPRLIGSFLAAGGLCILVGHLWGRLLLPLYRWEIAVLFPRYRILGFGVDTAAVEPAFVLQVALAAPVFFERAMLPPGTGLTGTTLLGHAVIHLLIVLTLAAVGWQRWPAGRLRLVLFASVLLVVVETLDVPLLLIGSIENLLLAEFAPVQRLDAPLVLWLNFLNSGGRIALSLAAGLLALAAAQSSTGGEGPQSLKRNG